MENVLICRAWCKGCGICVAFCPRNVLGLDNDGKAVVQAGQDCIHCGICERLCPDLAITVNEATKPEEAA